MHAAVLVLFLFWNFLRDHILMRCLIWHYIITLLFAWFFIRLFYIWSTSEFKVCWLYLPLERSEWRRQLRFPRSFPLMLKWTRSSSPAPSQCPPSLGPGRSLVVPPVRRSRSGYCRLVQELWRHNWSGESRRQTQEIWTIYNLDKNTVFDACVPKNVCEPAYWSTSFTTKTILVH